MFFLSINIRKIPRNCLKKLCECTRQIVCVSERTQDKDSESMCEIERVAVCVMWLYNVYATLDSQTILPENKYFIIYQNASVSKENTKKISLFSVLLTIQTHLMQ